MGLLISSRKSRNRTSTRPWPASLHILAPHHTCPTPYSLQLHILAFCDITPCRLVNTDISEERFASISRVKSLLASLEHAVRPTAMSATVYQSTRRNMPEGHSTYSNNGRIIRFNHVQTCGNPPTCYGLFRPSSGRYATKKNTIMASYVIRW
jgi:hypothetical protein